METDPDTLDELALVDIQKLAHAELLGPVDLELSKNEIESICDMINNPIKRDDVNEPYMASHTHRTHFHMPTVPPKAIFDINRQKLPSFLHKRTILNSINNNSVVLITGATGCGKTTQVPQFILEDAAESKKPCRIICTQPRRLATVSVAKRVANERKEKLPGTVGYQIRLENCTQPNTSLIFMTR